MKVESFNWKKVRSFKVNKGPLWSIWEDDFDHFSRQRTSFLLHYFHYKSQSLLFLQPRNHFLKCFLGLLLQLPLHCNFILLPTKESSFDIGRLSATSASRNCQSNFVSNYFYYQYYPYNFKVNYRPLPRPVNFGLGKLHFLRTCNSFATPPHERTNCAKRNLLVYDGRHYCYHNQKHPLPLHPQISWYPEYSHTWKYSGSWWRMRRDRKRWRFLWLFA